MTKIIINIQREDQDSKELRFIKIRNGDPRKKTLEGTAVSGWEAGGELVPSRPPGLFQPLATWWSELTHCTVAVESGQESVGRNGS